LTRSRLLDQARALGARGLRILLAAEGGPDTPIDDPRDLTALGFIGISDPLRPTACAAVSKCQEAGIRVIMLTGDHPATARAIAREAGLLDGRGEVLTGDEIAELHNGELDARLERAAVIARATPLDKVRIIESLQRCHRTVAMTGDGVNDAPALRLADVGVAMGRGGTEVARQTADLVLVDDDFSTLVDALVEGRSYWSNVRRALGLLVGGNLGELGLVVGASVLGLAAPLSARQVLGVNIITDVLPGLAVALQQPEYHNLAQLALEGEASLGVPLRNDILRRAGTTAAPSLVATLIASLTEGPAQASTVAFTSIVTTQLFQTVDASRTDQGWNGPMLAAVGGSLGALGGAVALPQLRKFLGLGMPTPLGLGLSLAATSAAVVLNRVFTPSLATPMSMSTPLALSPERAVPLPPG
jgi:magnesium-transporting ATPase (P-type)